MSDLTREEVLELIDDESSELDEGEYRINSDFDENDMDAEDYERLAEEFDDYEEDGIY